MIHIANEFIIQLKAHLETKHGELKRELSKYVTKGVQRNEISSYMLRDFPQCSWSIKTLDRRMRYFNIFYHKNVSLNAVKEGIKGDLNGPERLGNKTD